MARVHSSDGSPRQDIAKLARNARGGLLDIDAASEALKMPRRQTALRLGALERQGWLARVRRGLYTIVPLEADPTRPALSEDPWVVATLAFAPCYIGGWSAAEHWGLTEQLFRATLVITAAHVRQRAVRLQNYDFTLFAVPPKRLEGAVRIWRSNEQVSVSDCERTLVDCARDPKIAAGASHLTSMIVAYGRSENRDDDKLISTARSHANGAAWKRLGFLIENLWPENAAFTAAAQESLTQGYTKLEPSIANRGKLATRWRLWVNIDISVES